MKYFNLKETRSQNALALEDVDRMWIPFLVFDNTEKNEATKVSSCLLCVKVFGRMSIFDLMVHPR